MTTSKRLRYLAVFQLALIVVALFSGCQCGQREGVEPADEKPVDRATFSQGGCTVVVSPFLYVKPSDYVTVAIDVEENRQVHITEIKIVPEEALQDQWSPQVLYHRDFDWPDPMSGKAILAHHTRDSKTVKVKIPSNVKLPAAVKLVVKAECIRVPARIEEDKLYYEHWLGYVRPGGAEYSIHNAGGSYSIPLGLMTGTTGEVLEIEDWSLVDESTSGFTILMKCNAAFDCYLNFFDSEGKSLVPSGPRLARPTKFEGAYMVKIDKGVNELEIPLQTEYEWWPAVGSEMTYTVEIRELHTELAVETKELHMRNDGGELTIENIDVSWQYDSVAQGYKVSKVTIHTSSSGLFPIMLDGVTCKVEIPAKEESHNYMLTWPRYIMLGERTVEMKAQGPISPPGEKKLSLELKYLAAKNEYKVASYQISLTEPVGPPPEPVERGPAYQEADVSATALKLSGAWPTIGHDLQRTGRSPNAGPENPFIKWQVDEFTGASGAPLIGPDNTIYFCFGNLCAVTTEGNIRWKFDKHTNSATVAPDGTIYFGSYDGYVYAVAPDGQLKWKFAVEGNGARSAPVISSDGTIYFGAGEPDVGYLCALTSDGKLKWKFATNDQILGSPAMSNDGTILVSSGDGYLYALNSNGELQWGYSPAWSSPAIASDGTIYIMDGRGLYALNPDGSLKWESEIISGKSSLAIGTDGIVYVGSADGKLHAIDPDGNFKWSFATEGSYMCALAIDSNGTIYVGASGDNNIYALNHDGSLKWKFDIGYPVQDPIAIGLDGTIYTGWGQAITDE